MALPTSNRNPCTKCGSVGWVFPCEGCHASFCIKHAPEHRAELLTQLDTIESQHDHLQHIYNRHEKRQEHPLYPQIDVWEHDAIVKIQQTAQIARNELRQILDQSNDRMKTILTQFHHQLAQGRESDHFNEIELDRWKEQLINIRKQLETACDIELVPDRNSLPIYLIQIISTQQEAIGTTSSSSQSTNLNNDTKDIECACGDEVEEPKSSILDTKDHSSIELSEPSTMPKEEPETNLDSCNTLSIASSFRLDPTKTYHLVVLQLSPTVQSLIPSILNKLTDHPLQIFTGKTDCLRELECSEQATVFIDTTDISPNERNDLLDNISELDTVHFIYIQSGPSEKDNDDDDEQRNQFFRRYPRIKAMFDNEQRLMVQWAIDTANECKKAGDVYIELEDKDRGRQCFEEGIKLYKHLSVFLNDKRRVR